MSGPTNCRALTTVKCFYNNDIIMLRVKYKEAVCLFSRGVGEAKNKTNDMIITIRKQYSTTEYILRLHPLPQKSHLPCPQASIKLVKVVANLDTEHNSRCHIIPVYMNGNELGVLEGEGASMCIWLLPE